MTSIELSAAPWRGAGYGGCDGKHGKSEAHLAASVGSGGELGPRRGCLHKGVSGVRASRMGGVGTCLPCDRGRWDMSRLAADERRGGVSPEGVEEGVCSKSERGGGAVSHQARTSQIDTNCDRWVFYESRK